MIPYYIKIPAKLVLARVPVSRTLLNRLGMFRHGSMVRPDYAHEIVQRHLKAADVSLVGKTVLELGPGDSVGNGIIARVLGAQASVLVDAGDWAVKSPEVYRDFVMYLGGVVQDPEALDRLNRPWSTFDELLEAFNIQYRTGGLSSLRELESASVDFWFSEAVLEHVRVDDFENTLVECFRVMRLGARGSHVVDYKDHLQAGLNNMRFGRGIWESRWMASSGFYTNRLRHPDVVAALRRAGFEVLRTEPSCWPEVPLPRNALAQEFRHYDDEALRIREAAIVVEVPSSAG